MRDSVPVLSFSALLAPQDPGAFKNTLSSESVSFYHSVITFGDTISGAISKQLCLISYLEIIMEDLAAKKCVPCNSKDLQAMTKERANDLLLKVAGWNLVNEIGILKLNCSWKVKSFTKGLELFKLVGNVAEAEGHHPDLHLVGWNNITIEIWTHAMGGLTENDFILAARINGLNLHHLLRKKAAA
ncbi:PREDICTED: uncharacterized protein LOC105140292 [Populus euphratica]|uniref:4a-hydroxytetrahydrobiopterin dehydratase n=1 Tax=Populus euphratica TaxID=75702 RepID=A0AAJ6Y7K6_POPEU|nr:PREDICTED: uncharacterized protein LOC105140292 [Populus euphratica]